MFARGAQRFGMGIRGAAWATAGSQYIAVVVLLRALHKSKVGNRSPVSACEPRSHCVCPAIRSC